MTLPNKLTIFRIFIIPLMIITYYFYSTDQKILDINLKYIILNIIFIIAALTDFLDGYLARKNNLVTTFGKFADPLADKILVFAALLILLDINIVPLYVVVIILIREFMVSGIRLVVVETGEVIAASKLGKYKTFFTMFSIIFLFLYELKVLNTIGMVLLYISLFLTILSGIDYFIKSKKVILKSI